MTQTFGIAVAQERDSPQKSGTMVFKGSREGRGSFRPIFTGGAPLARPISITLVRAARCAGPLRHSSFLRPDLDEAKLAALVEAGIDPLSTEFSGRSEENANENPGIKVRMRKSSRLDGSANIASRYVN